MTFLKAEWRKLAIANYAVDPGILAPHVPPETELDIYQGKAYVSLIGFMFLNTRVLGVPVPWHINFPEVNLRFYVRHLHDGEWRRGVSFIKELVDLPAITFVANNLYKEHYETTKMKWLWEEGEESRKAVYDWKCKGQWQRFGVTADLFSQPIPEGAEAEFITEHYWGYTKTSETSTVEYGVTHPRWETYPVQHFEIDVDFGANYGAEFADLSDRSPDSVMLAEGSEITVEGKRGIRSQKTRN